MSVYSQEELSNLWFKYLGSDVKLPRKASIHSVPYISIANSSRIDYFCVIPADKGGTVDC